MFSKTLLAFAIASATVVSAVDLCGYSDTLGCSGAALCCRNASQHFCCSFVAGFGFSVQYTNLPGVVSDGQAWTSSNCVAGGVFTDQIGTGTKCFVSGGAQKINSASWTNTASKGVVDAVVPGIITPNIFKFTVDGVEKRVPIPAGEDSIEAMLALYKAGNFTGLEAFGNAN
ncbi:hypothetical protein B0H14DRAFT_2540133 [Mycena olivaceomarginata]|nr:hypothetical protein B0H14DRAFT_2540133 [Mycena olivaceomarginata]